MPAQNAVTTLDGTILNLADEVPETVATFLTDDYQIVRASPASIASTGNADNIAPNPSGSCNTFGASEAGRWAMHNGRHVPRFEPAASVLSS